MKTRKENVEEKKIIKWLKLFILLMYLLCKMSLIFPATNKPPIKSVNQVKLKIVLTNILYKIISAHHLIKFYKWKQ
ncbi:hypothetical protein AAV35_004505 [Salimicrobium jeotgali]|nr:hypothetical protein AAV35_004505 [Salimicrobium jeotgali]